MTESTELFFNVEGFFLRHLAPALLKEQLLKCIDLHFFLSKKTNAISNVRSNADADCFQNDRSRLKFDSASIGVSHFFETHSVCQISEGTLVSRFAYFPETGDPLLKLLFNGYPLILELW